ncbi:hypothetical protein NC653_022145 [Populus alba x Populus x berolinensis]|uniref:Uncharacterized protein n=1 Tax=Populus alba x Populus x berolinensis TaxID=444605 RepID=A0AAD6QFL6_9ROSI|nr:hypothetical protein NC653_022145 [Populus alba x Populus x berolinensis]
MAVLGSGSCTLLRLTPSIHDKRRIAHFCHSISFLEMTVQLTGLKQLVASSRKTRDQSCYLMVRLNRSLLFVSINYTSIFVFKYLFVMAAGVCNLCNGGVRRIRYEALQSEAGRKLLRRSGRAPDDISSVVLVERVR